VRVRLQRATPRARFKILLRIPYPLPFIFVSFRAKRRIPTHSFFASPNIGRQAGAPHGASGEDNRSNCPALHNDIVVILFGGI
jgi:hypothetical protein